MENKPWIGLAGIAVSVLIGAPQLVALARDPSTAVNAFWLLSSAGLAALSLAAYFLLKQPPWTVKHFHLTCRIQDEAGDLVVIRKFLRLRSNNGHGTTYEHPAVQKAGLRSPIRHSPNVVLKGHVDRGGERIFEVQIPKPVGFLGECAHWIELDYEGQFHDDPEGLILPIQTPTSKLDVEVHFPEGRMPKTDETGSPLIWTVFRGTGAPKSFGNPTRNGNVWSVRASRAFPTLPRGTYELQWRW